MGGGEGRGGRRVKGVRRRGAGKAFPARKISEYCGLVAFSIRPFSNGSTHCPSSEGGVRPKQAGTLGFGV